MVGSTKGSGPGYGLSTGDDEDGFVTVLDPTSGEILGEGIREGSPDDDIVTGTCMFRSFVTTDVKGVFFVCVGENLRCYVVVLYVVL